MKNRNFMLPIVAAAAFAFAAIDVARAQQPQQGQQTQQQPQQGSTTSSQKSRKTPTTQQQIDQSVQSGTVPSQYRNSVPKEYQQYIPFGR